jgi:hypothetical protein
VSARNTWTVSRDVITADASKVSGAEFFRAIFGGESREERYAKYLEQLIGRIQRGDDLYGNPPLAVADARKLIAEREAQLTQVHGDPMLKRRRA